MKPVADNKRLPFRKLSTLSHSSLVVFSALSCSCFGRSYERAPFLLAKPTLTHWKFDTHKVSSLILQTKTGGELAGDERETGAACTHTHHRSDSTETSSFSTTLIRSLLHITTQCVCSCFRVCLVVYLALSASECVCVCVRDGQYDVGLRAEISLLSASGSASGWCVRAEVPGWVFTPGDGAEAGKGRLPLPPEPELQTTWTLHTGQWESLSTCFTFSRAYSRATVALLLAAEVCTVHLTFFLRWHYSCSLVTWSFDANNTPYCYILFFLK